MLNELSAKDLDSLLARGDLKFYNFYNTDLEINNVLSTQHYLDTPTDTFETNQPVHTIFLDIEVYHEDRSIKFEFDKSDHPVNAITTYNTKNKEYKCFYLLKPINRTLFNPDKNYYLDYMTKDNKYADKSDTLDIYTYSDELQLIQDCWSYIKQSNILVLSGYNSDTFDYPYMYRRLLKLLNNDKNQVASVFSQFKFVEFRNERLKIPDYPICDLLYLYKTRDNGGLNYGQKLPSYTLDAVSEVELGLNKLEYKGQVTDISGFYETDPTNFLLYNIIDVALCNLLNKKLKHIELHNLLRRMMKIPFSMSMIGSSALFEGYTLFRLSEKNKKVRHGLVAQNNKSISELDLKNIVKPITKKNDLRPTTIKQQDYSKITRRFDGAYVKEPKPRIVHGTIIDLDAGSLYPSKILESNIGFDTYQARIINTNTYKLLQLLEAHIGISPLPNTVYINTFKLIEDYTTKNKKKLTNQNQFKKQMYFTIMFLLQRLVESNVQMKDIYEPKNDEHYYLLMFYLLPLLDLFTNIHPNREVYNPFIFDLIFRSELEINSKYQIIYIIDSIGSSSPSIKKLNVPDSIEFLNKYSYTICGTCFDKHETNIGIYSEMLKNLSALRKSFRSKLADYPEGSEEYEFNNSRQKAVKIAANSSYGVYGLSSFRYSNHWLAQSITSQGRLTLKLSQYLTENYMRQLYE